jgi:PAS domain S-box-containing protein
LFDKGALSLAGRDTYHCLCMSAIIEPESGVGAQLSEERATLLQSGLLHSLPVRVLDDTPLGVIIWDGTFRVAEWNQAASRIFGWSHEQALNQHASFILAPEVRPLVDDIFRSLMRAAGGTHSVNDNLHHDGHLIVCEWHNTPLRRDDGQVVGVLSLVHDISERRKLEESLRQLAAERAISLAEAQQQAAQRNQLLAEMNEQLVTIQRQHSQIVALSAPLLDVWLGVLAIPMVGSLDSLRISEVTERLLSAVSERRVQFVILDLTGVDNLDTNNAAQLIRLLSALRLLGATGIVTGIHPVVAQIVVQLGVDLHSIVTLRSLQEALRYCMDQSKNGR